MSDVQSTASTTDTTAQANAATTVPATSTASAGTPPTTSAPKATAVSESKSSPWIWVLLGLIIALLIAAITVMLFYPSLLRPSTSNTGNNTNTGTDNETDSLTVTSPKEGDTVTGKIDFEGTFSIEEETGTPLQVQLFDSNDKEAALPAVVLLGDNDFNGSIYIENIPETDAGYVLFTLTDGNNKTVATKKVTVSFDKEITASVAGKERLKVTSPMSDQLLRVYEDTGSFTVSGEMKDFFEATVSLKVVDAAGTVLYTGSATATEDNYGQFAPFTKAIKYTDVKDTDEKTGKIVFFDVSAKDGSETTILELPVTLYVGE